MSLPRAQSGQFSLYLQPTSVEMNQILVLFLLAAAAVPSELASVRQKRTIMSGISNWWYGSPTEAPETIESAPFYEYSVQYGAQPHIVDVVQDSYVESDLGRLARELGLTGIRNLPPMEEVRSLLGVQTNQEAIDAIRDFAQTPGGLEMIEKFLSDDDEYVPTAATEVVRDARQLQGAEQADRIHTDSQIVQRVAGGAEVSPGFFGRVGYWASFLNPFSGWQSVDVPLPAPVPEKTYPDYVTVMPPVLRYPEGYDPKTRSFSKVLPQNRVQVVQQQAGPVPVVPFHIDLSNDEFNPSQVEALRQQLYLQRYQQVRNQVGTPLVVSYQGQQFLVQNPPFQPVPVAFPAPVPVPQQIPVNQQFNRYYPQAPVPRPQEIPQRAPVTPETPADTYNLDLRYDSDSSASQPEVSVVAPEDNKVDSEDPESDKDEVVELLRELEVLTTPIPDEEEEIVTTKEEIEREMDEVTTETPSELLSGITKLHPVSSSEPRRLSLELSSTGRIHKTDPEALESAINAVRVAPDHELAESMRDMVNQLTTDPRNAL